MCNPDSVPLPEDCCYGDIQLRIGLVGHPYKQLKQARLIQWWLHALLFVDILLLVSRGILRHLPIPEGASSLCFQGLPGHVVHNAVSIPGYVLIDHELS